MECAICKGERRVAVGWSQVPRSTYKIKVEYDPCPRCTEPPHSFHAIKVAKQIDAIHERDAK